SGEGNIVANIKIRGGPKDVGCEEWHGTTPLPKARSIVDAMCPGITKRVVHVAETQDVGRLLRQASLQCVVIRVRSVLELLFLAKTSCGQIWIDTREDISRGFIENTLGTSAV